MKVLRKLLMLVLLGSLLIGIIGSEVYGYGEVVNRGRSYCPVHDVIYEQVGSHQNCQPVVRHVVVAPEQYCAKCNTRYSAGLRHVCPPVRVVRQTTRRRDYVPKGSLQRRYQEVPREEKTYYSSNNKSTNFSLAKYANVSIAFVQQPTRVVLSNLYGVNQYGYRYIRYPAGTGYTSRGNRVLWGSNW